MSTPANPDVFAWRWGDDAADANTPDWDLDGGTTVLNTTYEVNTTELDTPIFLYVGIENDGEKNEDGDFDLTANIDGAGPVAVTTSSNGVRVASGADTDGDAITSSNVGTGAGSYENGTYDDGDGTIATNLTAANYTNHVFCIQFLSANLSGGESIDFAVRAGGTDCTNDSGATINVTIESSGPAKAVFGYHQAMITS
jgi:hypothetical protein